MPVKMGIYMDTPMGEVLHLLLGGTAYVWMDAIDGTNR